MFGYVNVIKNELKIKDYDKYRAYYCGLCNTLKDRYGNIATATLSYDVTFLVVFLSSLYECETVADKKNCIIHPVGKKNILINEITEYAADMNIILTYYKLMDDWKDDNSKKAVLGIRIFRKDYIKAEELYPDKCEHIRYYLRKLAYYERNRETNVDKVSGAFGGLMAVLFDYKDDIWKDTIKKMAFYLGKFIYLIDAHEDMEDDRRTGSYNIFNQILDDYKKKHKTDTYEDTIEQFEKSCESLLNRMMAECTAEFEKLPCVENIDILRNILYAGVWSKYENNKKTNENNKL